MRNEPIRGVDLDLVLDLDYLTINLYAEVLEMLMDARLL